MNSSVSATESISIPTAGGSTSTTSNPRRAPRVVPPAPARQPEQREQLRISSRGLHDTLNRMARVQTAGRPIDVRLFDSAQLTSDGSAISFGLGTARPWN